MHPAPPSLHSHISILQSVHRAINVRFAKRCMPEPPTPPPTGACLLSIFPLPPPPAPLSSTEHQKLSHRHQRQRETFIEKPSPLFLRYSNFIFTTPRFFKNQNPSFNAQSQLQKEGTATNIINCDTTKPAPLCKEFFKMHFESTSI